MFAAFTDACPDIEVVKNPFSGGGGVSQPVVLQSRIIAGIPPDTFQTLSSAKSKGYVDSDALKPLDGLYAELDYASVAIIIFTQVRSEFFLALSLSSLKTRTVQVVMAEAKGTTLVLYNL